MTQAHITHSNSLSDIQAQPLTKKIIAAVFAITFATLIIGAVGFAPGYAHNAAHDTRHALVFPCH